MDMYSKLKKTISGHMGESKNWSAVRVYHYDASKESQLIKLVDTLYQPVLSKVEGFVSYQWVSMGGGKSFSITTTKCKKSCDEASSVAKKVIAENAELKSILTSEPEMWSGEVQVNACTSTMASMASIVTPTESTTDKTAATGAGVPCSPAK